MWLITTTGFFSIVEKPGDGEDLTVRARAAADLGRLRATFLPELGLTTGGGTDYAFRAKAPRAAVARATAAMVEAIDYKNFKSEVGKKDPERAHLYLDVWTALSRIEKQKAGWR